MGEVVPSVGFEVVRNVFTRRNLLNSPQFAFVGERLPPVQHGVIVNQNLIAFHVRVLEEISFVERQITDILFQILCFLTCYAFVSWLR